MLKRMLGLFLVAILAYAGREAAAEGHRFALQGKGRLAILEPDGKVSWEMNWGGVHDLQVTANGHIFVQQGAAKVAEIDPQTKMVVWSYDSAASNGNAGKGIEVHAFQPLENGHLMIAESGAKRIIEVDRDGKLMTEVPLKVLHPHQHTDTRLARKLPTGNYLVCHEGDGCVREYDGKSHAVVWEYDIPLFGQDPQGGHGPEAFGNKCFGARRLPNGHTLMTTGNGHSVLEVTPTKEIVWKLTQKELPGITLAWVTTIDVLPNGHYLIGNCHAGPGQPQLIEIDPSNKSVVWSFQQFDTWGNDVSNTHLLDVTKPKS